MSIVSLCLRHSVQMVIQNSGILFKFKLSTFYPVTMTLSLCALYPALDKLYPFVEKYLASVPYETGACTSFPFQLFRFFTFTTG